MKCTYWLDIKILVYKTYVLADKYIFNKYTYVGKVCLHLVVLCKQPRMVDQALLLHRISHNDYFQELCIGFQDSGIFLGRLLKIQLSIF